MASINLIKASDGTGNASTATVQTVRNSGVTTIIVDTVNNIPATFMGSMGTPHTFVDPVTAEEITVISEATAVDFTGHVSGANLEIDSIAPGYTDLGSAVGDIIVIRPTTDWANNIATVLAVAHSDTGAITTDTINENTAAAGVTIDGLTIKDGLVVGGAGKGVGSGSLNTTQGQMGGEWATYSPIASGFSAITVNVGRYLQIGKIMHLYLSAAGTSNTGYIGITLPSAPKSGGFFLIRVMDNGSPLELPGMLELTAGTTAAVGFIKLTGFTFTSSGTKSLYPVTIVYEVA